MFHECFSDSMMDRSSSLRSVNPPIPEENSPKTNHFAVPVSDAKSSSCTFCEFLNEPELVVVETGGNACGSIQLLAAKEVNGSDTCAIIQKEERVCCPGLG